MSAMYIERHNEAVRIVAKVLQKRSKEGGCFMIMDACKACEADKHSAASTRMLDFLLPSVSEEQRAKLRPDILRVTGLLASPTEGEIIAAMHNKQAHRVTD